MKTILFSLLICLATISGNAMSFTIQGNIQGLMPGDTLSFERINLPGFDFDFAFDVLVEKPDEFIYTGSQNNIGYYMMSYKPIIDRKIYSDRRGLTILINDGVTKLIGTADQIYYCQLEGGLYDNQTLQEVLQLETSLGRERSSFLKLFEDARAAGDTIKADEYLDLFNSFHYHHNEDFEKLTTLNNAFFEGYPSSEHAIIDALQSVNYAAFQSAKERFDKMDAEARQSYFGNILKQEIEKIEMLQPGNNAPDFQLVTTDGRKISLDDGIGSYVLIYHWGLCPGSLMIDNEVVDLYNEYRSYLNVIGITDNIQEIQSLYENTASDSKLMNLDLKPILANMLSHPWPEVEKTKDNAKIEKDFAFGGLPYFIFISPEGKIIARGFQEAFFAAKERLETEFGRQNSKI